MRRRGRRGQRPSVHISVFPAMTGVSRFGQLPANWTYSKEEGLTLEALVERRFTYLISADEKVPGYRHVQEVLGFHRLQVHARPRPRILRARVRPLWKCEPALREF